MGCLFCPWGRNAGTVRGLIVKMTGTAEGEDGSEELEDLDQPVFSLVSGKYRHAKRYGGNIIFCTLSLRRSS